MKMLVYVKIMSFENDKNNIICLKTMTRTFGFPY